LDAEKRKLSDRLFWMSFFVLSLSCLLQVFDWARGRAWAASFGTLLFVTPLSIVVSIFGFINIARPPNGLTPRHRLLQYGATVVGLAIFLTCVNLWLSFMSAKGWIELPIVIRIGEQPGRP